MSEEIIRSYGMLPPKIQRTIDQAEGSGSQVVLAIKTGFRLNSDMPYTYLVVMRGRVVVCSSHKTRGVHHNIGWDELNSVDCSPQGIRILVNRGDDVVLPIDTSEEALEEIVQAVKKIKTSY